ncbi:holo-acyl-carrier-protein synthase [Gordonia bronchialis DSM 43247]|uniref:Holo-[acyl-carrier-protein] synthase n=1 Tax=Gordonia bronchialis (strain ATCC 25592 / DSM 43247 / BCRC 13721 / JCM 3198 / KCTC 3076 / NBRC 16047 / NCTC 10667) TaxID=526226 RepID=D0L4F8_GORB4|nr:holo-ACP synthase [Gordonia bronchialis]ACY20382.1 holo-acyl-carrier-protein synthase [Gordonia bronchialis DSM 43247]MCC3323159.1 holo-ACP synthase [Gordonia bronchialis]QGS25815.1 4'-phosphopantetheinyl transferase superfamily protein [Gordonia bronchialis]UAK37786.1 holo-ACP synthase [Gordonia bronchialis]STQ63187.1 Holo-[acyl-carrier-protein] synthase [Gordonia bronchialis]
MSITIGCDLVALSEIEESVAAFGDRFLHRVFTASELVACGGALRTPRLAARFAAKEATIKALGLVDVATPPRDIEVLTGRGGPPELRLHGAIARLGAHRGWRDATVSLSHSHCHAIAVVAAEVD